MEAVWAPQQILQLVYPIFSDIHDIQGGANPIIVSDPIHLPAVDNIRVTTAVPEASTWAMMLSGLGLIGFIAGRKKSPG